MKNEQIATQFGIPLSTLSYWIKRLRKAGYAIDKTVSIGRPALQIPPAGYIIPEQLPNPTNSPTESHPTITQ
jgi:transposase